MDSSPRSPWSNDEPSIGGTPTSGYFIGKNPYNVCVYLVNPVVASGTIDAAALNGTTANLPTGLNGKYRIDVNGTWTNGSNGTVDAEYTSDDNWTTQIDGYDRNGFLLGEGFGDVQVNGGFVGWGAYNVNSRVQPDRAAHRHVGQPRRLRRRQQHEHEGRGLVRRQQRLAQLHDHLRRLGEPRASPRSDLTPHQNQRPRTA